MKYFHVHPDDARWLRRWLCKNLTFVLVMAWLLVLLRFEASVPLETMNPLQAAQSELAIAETTELSEPALLGSRYPKAVAPYPRAVAPDGWRRTTHGWEHASSWPLAPRPLGEIIKSQEDREPASIQLALALLREIPPLAFALIQMTAIAAILNVANRGGTASDRSTELP